MLLYLYIFRTHKMQYMFVFKGAPLALFLLSLESHEDLCSCHCCSFPTSTRASSDFTMTMQPSCEIYTLNLNQRAIPYMCLKM